MARHVIAADKDQTARLFGFATLMRRTGMGPTLYEVRVIKHQCMHNPGAANHPKGLRRQACLKIAIASPYQSANEWMRQRIDGETGKAIYGQRLAIVEPVFSNSSEQKSLRGFSLRSQAKVQGQWHLYCLKHNIEKWKNYVNLAEMAKKTE